MRWLLFVLFSLPASAQRFMPPQATDVAESVDSLYSFLLWASIISSVIVIGGLIWFAFQYRRKTPNDKTPYISHNTALEFLWSFIPFVIFMAAFGWGWAVYRDLRIAPKDSLEIYVGAQKWFWDFRYRSGKTSSGTLVVPVDTPVKLIMTSRDVIHSFFVPAFRVKQDAVPGKYSSLWFEANQVGRYQAFCTEYCGDQHSAMLATVEVKTREDFQQWLQDDPYQGLTLAQIGEKAVANKCSACHNLTQERKVGPGFLALYGANRSFTDGSQVLADENYIRESILNPNARVVAGYQGVMPTFQGQLTEDELLGIVSYLKELK